MRKKKVLYSTIFIFLLSLIYAIYAFYFLNVDNIDNIEPYNGVDKFIYINNNIPFFTDEDRKKDTFEDYSELDYLGRAGVAFALLSQDTMPTEERGEIGMIKPSGWHTVKYSFVNNHYLYNRCHLIGFQLAGENANPNNLITCTRSTNIGTMLEYENKVANYIKETGNHVLYRVTPYFEGINLLATGIEIEGESIEDNGLGIKFNIFIYNVEDGVKINYLDGTSEEE